jgi:aminoglycoside phosphotransferase (APT) family kinase protein
MLWADNIEFSIDWLTHTFDLGQPYSIVQAGRGQTNRLGVLRLETSIGSFAIKQFEQAPKQIALLIEEAAHKTGFPMPQPRRAIDGKPYGIYTKGANNIWVRVYSWVEGTPYDWGFVSPEVSTQIGKLLARIHALPVSSSELQDEPWMPLGLFGWEQLAQTAMARGMDWALSLQNKIPILVEWKEYIVSNTVTDEPVVPSQRDLHPPNVIRCFDGNHVVVDWDAAGPMNAREDVAKFALVWATPPGQPPQQDAVRAFIQGYREAGGCFESRGILDLNHQARTRLWWLAYNVGRDVSDSPGFVPDLTIALLSGVHPLDLEVLKRTAALLEI